jgi:hypothetical protein
MRQSLLSCFLIACCLIARGQDINHIIAETNLDSLVQTVRVLSGEDSTYVNGVKILIKTRSNYLSAEENDQAADYIKERLLKYNLKVEDQAFNINGRNILATQSGIKSPDSIYIICAHYDAVAYYCADDDASGVSAVIEAARILSNQCFDYTILYALWDNEEDGMLGSKYYAQLASSNGYKIAGVLNIEMIGYDSDNDTKFEIHTNNMPTSLAIKNELVRTVNNFSLSLNPQVINPGTTESDHSSFWNKNYGAVCFSELFFGGDGNPYYHSDGDRVGLFNLPYFKELSKLAIGTLATLARFNSSCQEGIKTLSVYPGNQNVSSNAGNTSFSITSNTNWTIADDAGWLSVNPTSGSGNGTITANYTTNTLATIRVGTITISGTGVSSQSVTVTQSGINTLSITPSNQDVGSEAGSTTFSITSSTGWTITDNAGWLTVNPASGSGNGTITASCTANTSATTRVGIITISGTGVSSQPVTVTQSGINTLSIAPSNRDVGSEAGSTTFSITSNTNWTIAYDADWLLVNPASGTGNGTITATFTASTLATVRIGTITISGTGVSSQPVTVAQSGINTLSVTPSNPDVGSEAGSTTFSITSNTSWTIASDAAWLTVSPANGSGNGTIIATFTASTLTTVRIGTITISGTGVSSQPVTVTQSGINKGWDLKQNYPNPFTNLTTIKFFVPKPCQVEITIFNVIGIKIDVLLNENLDSGWHSIDWIPSYSLKSGIYFYQLRSDEYQMTKKIMYNKHEL